MSHSPEKIAEHFTKLPSEIRDAITSVDFAEKLTGIGRKNNLLLTDLDEIFEEVGLVMLGLTPTTQFPENLRKRLQVEQSVFDQLIRDIDEEIFSPIREVLIKNTTPLPKNEDEEEMELSATKILEEIEKPSPVQFRTEPMGKELPAPHKISEIPKETNDPNTPVNTSEVILPSPLKEVEITIPKNLISSIKETPKPPSSSAQNIILQKGVDKLESIVRAPKEDSIISVPSKVVEGKDPYREAIDPNEQRLKF